MRKSFYHYMLRHRNEKAKNEIHELANSIYLDHGFPKGSEDYHEVSTYLELNGQYVRNMSDFDKAWELYKDDQE